MKFKKKPVEKSSADETRVHPALKEYFGYCLHKLSLKLKKQMTLALEKKDVCGPHVGILTVLSKIPEYNQLALGEELGIDKATMVKLIDQLEKNGLVERTPHSTDRRQKLIHLTKKGAETLVKVRKIASQLEKDLMSTLSPEEERVIRSVIPALLENMMKNESIP